MKFKLSRIAAALGMVGLATSVLADPIGPNVAPGTYASGPGVTDIYLAGSSAVDLALTKFIANSCLPSTLDSYRTDAGGKTYYLWTCEVNGTNSSISLSSGNTLLAIHKNTNSSSDGTNVIATNGSLAYLTVGDITAAASSCNVSPTTFAATPAIPSYNYYVCGTTAGTAGVGTGSAVPNFGFSDSEPAQFASPLSNASLVTAAYPLTIIFGIPVTKNLRDALQTAQGLTSGAEDEANMPTISSTSIQGIYTGRYLTWPAALGITVPGLTDQNVYKVRRSNGSGTTRAFDVTFIGDFCVATNPVIASGTTIVTSSIPTQCNNAMAGGVKSLQAGTSDDMAACLSSYQTNGNVAAIGYLSTDYLPAAGTDFYRWVKVDGYAPKQLNVVNDKWRDWSEESMNYNTATYPSGPTGDVGSFYNAVKATSANITLLSELSQNLTQTTSGQWTGAILSAIKAGKQATGWGVTPSAAYLSSNRTDASVLANPANPMTHQIGAGYSLCAQPYPASGYAPN